MKLWHLSWQALLPRSLRDEIALTSYKVASGVCVLLPRFMGPPIAYIGGSLAYAISAKRRHVMRANLAPVLGDVDSKQREMAVIKSFTSYAQYWYESFKMSDLSLEELKKYGRGEGMENLYGAIEKGRGAIVVAPHMGNWDFAAAWIDSDRVKINAVVEALEPPALFEWFVARRAQFGIKAIAHNENPMPKLIEAIKRNEVVVLVADRSLDAASVEVEFFGQKVRFPLGPAFLALRTGAPLLPTASYMEPRGGHLLRFLPELEIGERVGLRADARRLTQMVATSFETMIRQAPEQWHVFQPFFDTTPEPS